MTMKFERLMTPGDVEFRSEKAADGSETLIAEGFAARFDKRSEDLGGFFETVSGSAFNKTIKEADVRALFNHDPNQVLGRLKAGTLGLDIRQNMGLFYTITLPDSPQGRSIAKLIERGDVSGSSFGFRTIRDSWEERNGEVLRSLDEVALRDVGPATFPAYTDTDVSMRSLSQSTGVELQEVLEAAQSNELAKLFDSRDSDGSTPSEKVRRSPYLYI